MAHALYQRGVVGIGANALRVLRTALLHDLGEDQGATRLQEMGYAAGTEMYDAFREWLSSYADIDDPAALDASLLPEVLSEFFGALGWGTVHTERQGTLGLTITTSDWAETGPAAGDGPACFFSTGMLASFLTALAGGSPIAVMEIECRGQGSAQCRFLTGAPETLGNVYDAVSRGEDYRAALR